MYHYIVCVTRRAEVLASEVDDLRGELGDYNTVIIIIISD